MIGSGEFEAAGFNIHCRDVWPMGKVRESAMMAYKCLELQGTLKIQYPVLIKNGRLEIVYHAQIPHEWMLEALRNAEKEITGA